MLSGFKDFIMRGNAMEMAVGVVIGAAFASIVDSLTANLINPLIALLGNPDYSDAGFGVYLRPGHEATFINFGAVLTAIINFLLVAAVVYFAIVMPMNKLNEMQKRRAGVGEDEDEPAAPTETELLIEIRDLLSENNLKGNPPTQ